MTTGVRLTTVTGEKETRIFSLRGAHLLAMFARTEIAKQFRKWILNFNFTGHPRTNPACGVAGVATLGK